VFPVPERYVGVTRELTPGTIPAAITRVIPQTQFKPADKPLWLDDKALRASMGSTYDVQQGPYWTEFQLDGPVYGDAIGDELYNILGDYTQTATAGGTTTTTSGSNPAGAVVLNVTSGTSFTSGMWIWIEDSTGGGEIVQASAAGSSGSIPIANTPLRYTHAAAVAVANVSATNPVVNTFNLLNSTANTALGGGVQWAGQPPTHTFTDRTNVPAVGKARQYAMAVCTDLVLTGNASGLFTKTAKYMSFVGQIPGSPPSQPAFSTVRATPAWRSQVAVGGNVGAAQRNEIAEWQLTFTRKAKAYPTADGSQNPFIIARGELTMGGKLTYSPAVDESALLAMLGNTQPQVQILISNGLAGANLVSLQLDMPVSAFKVADLDDANELFGYTADYEPVNVTGTAGGVVMTPQSGGYSPVKATLTNGVQLY
jgi:hypothetical protein